MANALSNRLLDVALEDGMMRGPLSGMFPESLPVPSFAVALAPICNQLPKVKPGSGQLAQMAWRKAGQIKCGQLTRDECAAIVLYTMEDVPRERSLYYAMNAALREKNRQAARPWRDFVWLLLHALRKLPPSQAGVVFRGMPGKVLAEETEQQWSGFSSTATKVEVMEEFLQTNGPRTVIKLELTTPVGRDVSAFSLYPKECEVLLPPNVCFEVVSRWNTGSGLVMVQCKQTKSLDKLLDFSFGIPAMPKPLTVCKKNDDVYFLGTSQTFSNGDKLGYGQRGKVMGPSSSEPNKRVAVKFPGNKGCIDVTVPELSKEAPKPLAGGFKACEDVYFVGTPQTFSNGDKLAYGARGTVWGPGSSEERVLVSFQGNKGCTGVTVPELSKGKPLAGGFVASDDVYFIGMSQTLSSGTSCGSKLGYGQWGKVVGPSSSEPNKLVAVMFPGIKASINITVALLSKEAPKPLAGGFKAFEDVYFVGTPQTFSTGDKLAYGQRGTVLGPGPSKRAMGLMQVECPVGAGAGQRIKIMANGAEYEVEVPAGIVAGQTFQIKIPDAAPQSSILVMFQGNKGQIHVTAPELSKGKPLPGGFVANDDVYFLGTSQTFSSGNLIGYGQRGKVMGPSSSEPNKRVAVKFPVNKSCIDVAVSELSKEAPKPLAGGFKASEDVYFVGNGVANGARGTVIGPGPSEERVLVSFQGHKGCIGVTVPELSKSRLRRVSR